MSISREIWRRASPSNKRRLLRAKRAFPLAAGAALFGAYLVSVPWGQAYANMRARSDERSRLAPLVAEAERENLTFPQVVVSYPAHHNKLVYWNVTSPSSTTSYASGRPAWGVVWADPELVARDLPWQGGRVVARVVGVRGDFVALDYLGRP